jgi:hypothetical protein
MKKPKKITHSRLWRLGREYAALVAPHIIRQANEQKYHLPVWQVSELFPVLRDVYELLERDHGIPWDYLTTAKQDDFLIGWYNRLRELGVLERRS